MRKVIFFLSLLLSSFMYAMHNSSIICEDISTVKTKYISTVHYWVAYDKEKDVYEGEIPIRYERIQIIYYRNHCNGHLVPIYPQASQAQLKAYYEEFV